MSKSFVKSCSLKNTPEIMAWINAQKNFSSSILALIQMSLKEHNGIAVDAALEYQQKIDALFQQKGTPPSVMPSYPVNNPTPASPDEEISSQVAKATTKIGFEAPIHTNIEGFKNSFIVESDIPEEYL